MTVQIFSIGDIKKDLVNVGKMFESTDTLGGINSRHILGLEKKFFARTRKESVFVNSCTNGIYLVLKKLNSKNKHVIISPITFFGIAGAILRAGYVPLYSRVDKYGLMDTNSVEELCSQYDVAAIIPSHINNRYVDQIDSFDIPIIEDAAPAYGLKKNDGTCIIENTKNITVISFSYGKPLSAGEGGMIFTNKSDSDYYRGQRYCGLDNLDGIYGYGTFNVTDSDLKFANTSLAAALIINKLHSFEKKLELAKKIACFYHQELGNKHECDLYINGNHQTYIILSNKKLLLSKALDEHGIKSYSSHRPVYLNAAFKFDGAKDYINTSSKYYDTVLHIPCRYDLSDSEINLIAEVCKKVL